MPDFLIHQWPWYISGALIGLLPPRLLLLGNKLMGVSGNLRHICAAVLPRNVSFFKYDWKRHGLWNLTFITGILVGGLFAANFLTDPRPLALSPSTKADLMALGIHDFNGLMPPELFSWSSLLTLKGIVLIVVGGFLVGFGTSYAGGCTSGHGLSGLADMQLPSLVAVTAFFVGGVIASFLLLPLVL
jgi:uncharacterized membrane protein YedE/YeeE